MNEKKKEKIRINDHNVCINVEMVCRKFILHNIFLDEET